MTPTIPYPGLRPFQMQEADIFFGRGEQINQMLLKLETHRFLAVVGASGCGKSSLVRAGLLPALTDGFLSGAQSSWRFVVFRPGDDPFGRLARALHSAEGELMPAEAAALTAATLNASDHGLLQAISDLGVSPDTHVLILVDQFEELFRFRRRAELADGNDAQTVYRLRNAATAFVNQLLKTARQTERVIHVVLTMRSDFLGDCDAFLGLPEAINTGQFLVPRITREQLRSAIEDPLKLVRAWPEPALVERLLNDIGIDPDQLPLMQHCLLRLWSAGVVSQESKVELRLRDYLDPHFGGLDSALSNHLDEVYGDLTVKQQTIAEKMFRSLCDKDDDGKWTRRWMTIADMGRTAAVPPDEVFPVVDAFIRAGRNFLVASRDGTLTPQTTVDISHEALIRQWGRMQAWLQKEQESAQQYRRLLDTARRWKAGTAGLWGTPDLDMALKWRDVEKPSAEWAKRYGGELELTEKFLQAALALREQHLREELAQANALRRRAWWLGAVAAVSLILFVYAWYQQTIAAKNEIAAKESAEKAADLTIKANASEALARKNELAAERNLALTHIEVGHLRTERRDLRAGIYRYWRAFDEAPPGDRLRLSARSLLGAWNWHLGIPFVHNSSVRAVAFSLDGKAVATAAGARARLWNRETGALIAELPHTDLGSVLAFSADSQVLFTGTQRLYDARSGMPVGPALDIADPAESGSFDASGKKILVGGVRGTCSLIERETGKSITILHPAKILAVAFVPESTIALTAGHDGTVKLWDAVTGKLRHELKHSTALTAVACSADGLHVATGSKDKQMRLWEVKTGTQVGEPLPHQSVVHAIAFHPSEPFILAGCGNGECRLWSRQTLKSALIVSPHEARADTPAHDASVEVVHFTPDGRYFLTASQDKTAKVWNTATRKPLGKPFSHQGLVSAAVFSPEGTQVLTGSTDHVAWLWPLRLGEALGKPTERQADVVAVAVSPNGEMLASASTDSSVRLWDSATRSARGGPLKHGDRVNAIAFSPDGQFLLTASDDTYARLWDAKNGKLVQAITHASGVRSIAFSRDGSLFLTADADGTAQLWEAGTDAKMVGSAMKHRKLTSAILSPDGRIVCTVGGASIQLWDVPSGKQLTEPLVHKSVGTDAVGNKKETPVEVVSASFSYNAKYVVAGCKNGTAQVWVTASGKPYTQAQHNKEVVTAVAFSPMEYAVVTASKGGTAWLSIWEDGRARIEMLQQKVAFTTVGFSDDGRTLVTAGVDGTTQLWEAHTGKPLGEPLQHRASVNAIAFYPNGQALVTGCKDGVVRLWPLLPPASADREKLRLSVEVRTGYYLDALGVRQSLKDTDADWLNLRSRLDRFVDVRSWNDLSMEERKQLMAPIATNK